MHETERPTLQQTIDGDENSGIDLKSLVNNKYEPDIDPKYRKMMEDWKKKNPLWDFSGSALTCASANEIFEPDYRDVPAQPLFGDLVRTGELTILFADTGLGKSILAIQIADAITKGTNAIGARTPSSVLNSSSAYSQLTTHNSQLLPNASEPISTMYVDFEMSKSQAAERYSAGFDGENYIDKYEFPGLLQRAFPDWTGAIPEPFKSYAEFAGWSIRQDVHRLDIQFLIVDNISWLTSGQGPREATKLMKTLKMLKDDERIGILVLAHTPKRLSSGYLTVSDLAGSKSIANFADNIFALGRSKRDPELRYLKQIKQRNAPVTYGEDNVIVCRLEKHHNFPRFEIVDLAHERTHTLRSLTDPGYNREKIIDQCHQLTKIGWPQRKIADHLNISLTTVNRYLMSVPEAVATGDLPPEQPDA